MSICVYLNSSRQVGVWESGTLTDRTDSGTQFGISRLSPAQTAPWPGTSSLLGSGKQGSDRDRCSLHPQRAPRTGEEPGGERRADGPLCKMKPAGKRRLWELRNWMAGWAKTLRSGLLWCSVGKHPPANAGGVGSVPDTGGSHMRRRNC